jgi:hypothetical protein
VSLPYSAEVLYALLAGYNAALWPAQVLATVLALAALALAFRPRAWSSRAIALVLAAGWAVCGYVFHLQHFQAINFFAGYFAPVFLLQALLLLWTGTLRGRLAFRIRHDAASGQGLALIATALVLVPLLGWLGGYGLEGAAIVGLAPAPTLLFTLGLLLQAEGRTPVYLLVLPLVAAGIGAAEAWFLRLPWEALPPALALLAVAAILVRNRRLAARA